MSVMKKLTKCQMTVLETLADVAEHEGGEIVLKNRYHSPAASLVRGGLVTVRDDFPYRPKYKITQAGIDALNAVK